MKQFLSYCIPIVFGIYLLACTSVYAQDNVGIGTSSPTQKLDVIGTTKTTGFQMPTGATNGYILKTDASGVASWTNPAVTTAAVPYSGTNNTAGTIPDQNCTGLNSSITLSGLPTSVPSSSISVTVNITINNVRDLSLYLAAPNGDILCLAYYGNNNCCSGTNFTNTIFNDNGVSLNCVCTGPYTATYKPLGNMTTICSTSPTVGNFAAIGGGTINPNGTWQLNAFDQGAQSGNQGILNSWSVAVASAPEGSWSLNGNAGISSANFIGTTDNAAIRFRVNNEKAGLIEARNSSFPYGGNTVFGHKALYSNTTGRDNVASGTNALYSNKTGNYNIATGMNALYSNTTGTWNIANGPESLYSNTTGGANLASGSYALHSNSTGDENVAIGPDALYFNTEGYANVATGSKALYQNTIGFYNVANGLLALGSNTEGYRNVASGINALFSNTTGDYNTALGSYADVASGDLTNATAIGARAMVSQSNSLVLGSINGVNGATSNVKVGIGTTTPTTSLDVSGDVKLGIYGSMLKNIVKATPSTASLLIGANTTAVQTYTVTNAVTGSSVMVSPASAINAGLVIAYTRVSSVNTVEVAYRNTTGSSITLSSGISLYITLIQ